MRRRREVFLRSRILRDGCDEALGVALKGCMTDIEDLLQLVG